VVINPVGSTQDCHAYFWEETGFSWSFSQSSAETQQGSAATQWSGAISRSDKSAPMVSS
jgi:hypothetical protein